MSLEQLYFIAEIVAALAVIISIVYLGLQIRMTRIQNKKEIHLGMSAVRSEITFNLASNKELSFLVAQGLSGKHKMSANEYFRFSNFAFSYFVAYEVAYHRSLSKDIDRDIAEGFKDSLRWWLSFPGVQMFWKNNRDFGFSRKFKLYVEDSLKKINSTALEEIYENQIKFMEKAGMQPTSNTKKTTGKTVKNTK